MYAYDPAVYRYKKYILFQPKKQLPKSRQTTIKPALKRKYLLLHKSNLYSNSKKKEALIFKASRVFYIYSHSLH